MLMVFIYEIRSDELFVFLEALLSLFLYEFNKIGLKNNIK